MEGVFRAREIDANVQWDKELDASNRVARAVLYEATEGVRSGLRKKVVGRRRVKAGTQARLR
jgi:hypothetical protein